MDDRISKQTVILTMLAATMLVVLIPALERVSPPVLIGSLIFFIALGLSFIRGTDALYLIAISIMFSPEIGTGVSTGRTGGEGGGGVTLRAEDIVLLAVGCGWLLRTAYHKRHFGIMRTPLNAPIMAYVVISFTTTLYAVTINRVQLLPGIFHNLKYFEYFFLFFMILAHVRNRKIITRVINFSLVIFLLAVLYGYPQIDLTGTTRVCAPFDAEPNTFGGYIVLMMCIAFGIIQTAKGLSTILPLAIILVVALPPFLFTLSRASYMALIGGLLAFMVLSPRRLAVAMLVIGMIAVTLLTIPFIPERVQNRIAGTFQQQREYHVRIAGVDLDSSTSARLVSYKQAIELWQTSPLAGKGVTGTHFIDSQYFRLLAETGILGLGAFLFIMLKLILEIWRVYRQCEDRHLAGAALGFLCGIFALLVHALSANTFIIVRIAEPFWLMAGLLLLIPHVDEDEKDPEESAS